MPKDFNEFASNPEHFSNYEKPKTIEKQQKNISFKNVYKEIYIICNFLDEGHFFRIEQFISTGILSILTAPLTTAYISLQLSSQPLGKYSNIEQKINFPPNINEIEKKKIILLTKNIDNKINLPYKNPVFFGYKDVFKSLGNQGLFGFYKGNGIGVLYTWLSSSLKSLFVMKIENNYNIKEQYQENMIRIFGFTLIDIFLHPLLTIQSRFILQDRRIKFATYKNIFDFISDNYNKPKKIFSGISFHLPKNILITLCMNNYFKLDPQQSFLISNLLSLTFIYPLLTIIRRLQCQDLLPGMLTPKYSGPFNGLKICLKEEGIKGIYRGFGGYFVVSTFMMAFAYTVQKIMRIEEEAF